MKIAIFRTDSSTQDPATYNSQEMGLAKGFSLLGHVVDIVIASSTGQLSEKVVEETNESVRVIEVPFRVIPILNEPIYQKVGDILLRGQYDYVQINEEGSLASYLIARTCLRLGVEFGIYQGMYRILSGRRRALYEVIHHRLFRPLMRKYAICAFCKTSQAQNFLEQRDYKTTHVVPVGLDFSKFQNRKDTNWRTQLGISRDDQLVLYVGQLERRRNPEFITQLATESNKNVQFVLVGEGPLRSQLETIKFTRNLTNLHLLGLLNQAELPSLYEQADVFILPSDYEIYGMVIAESLFFGTPVLSTRTAGSLDIISDNTLGILMPDLNVRNWLNIISKYGANKSSVSQKEERLRYAENKFNWKDIAYEYTQLIEIYK